MTDGNGEMNPNFPKVEMHEINENHSGILKYHVSNEPNNCTAPLSTVIQIQVGPGARALGF